MNNSRVFVSTRIMNFEDGYFAVFDRGKIRVISLPFVGYCMYNCFHFHLSICPYTWLKLFSLFNAWRTMGKVDRGGKRCMFFWSISFAILIISLRVNTYIYEAHIIVRSAVKNSLQTWRWQINSALSKIKNFFVWLYQWVYMLHGIHIAWCKELFLNLSVM